MKTTIPKIKKPKYLHAARFCMLAVTLALWTAAELSATPPTTIRVRDQVAIDGDEVLLGQIAEIEGSDVRLIRQLKDILIGKAPLPGKSRQYQQSLLKMRLKQYDIDLSTVILEAPELIEVSRSCIKIQKQKIEEIVSGFLLQNISRENKNIRIKEIRVPEEVVLSKGNIAYKVTAVPSQSNSASMDTIKKKFGPPLSLKYWVRWL